MQREDVEALCAPIEKIVNYEYSERDHLIHNCGLGSIDMGQLQDLCAAARALLAERDAAFAARQEEMRERAARVLVQMAEGVANTSAHPQVDLACANALAGSLLNLAETVNALPIKDHRNPVEAPPPRPTDQPG